MNENTEKFSLVVLSVSGLDQNTGYKNQITDNDIALLSSLHHGAKKALVFHPQIEFMCSYMWNAFIYNQRFDVFNPLHVIQNSKLHFDFVITPMDFIAPNIILLVQEIYKQCFDSLRIIEQEINTKLTSGFQSVAAKEEELKKLARSCCKRIVELMAEVDESGADDVSFMQLCDELKVVCERGDFLTEDIRNFLKLFGEKPKFMENPDFYVHARPQNEIYKLLLSFLKKMQDTSTYFDRILKKIDTDIADAEQTKIVQLSGAPGLKNFKHADNAIEYSIKNLKHVKERIFSEQCRSALLSYIQTRLFNRFIFSTGVMTKLAKFLPDFSTPLSLKLFSDRNSQCGAIYQIKGHGLTRVRFNQAVSQEYIALTGQVMTSPNEQHCPRFFQVYKKFTFTNHLSLLTESIVSERQLPELVTFLSLMSKLSEEGEEVEVIDKFYNQSWLSMLEEIGLLPYVDSVVTCYTEHQDDPVEILFLATACAAMAYQTNTEINKKIHQQAREILKRIHIEQLDIDKAILSLCMEAFYLTLPELVYAGPPCDSFVKLFASTALSDDIYTVIRTMHELQPEKGYYDFRRYHAGLGYFLKRVSSVKITTPDFDDWINFIGCVEYFYSRTLSSGFIEEFDSRLKLITDLLAEKTLGLLTGRYHHRLYLNILDYMWDQMSKFNLQIKVGNFLSGVVKQENKNPLYLFFDVLQDKLIREFPVAVHEKTEKRFWQILSVFLCFFLNIKHDNSDEMIGKVFELVVHNLQKNTEFRDQLIGYLEKVQQQFELSEESIKGFNEKLRSDPSFAAQRSLSSR